MTRGGAWFHQVSCTGCRQQGAELSPRELHSFYTNRANLKKRYKYFVEDYFKITSSPTSFTTIIFISVVVVVAINVFVVDVSVVDVCVGND